MHDGLDIRPPSIDSEVNGDLRGGPVRPTDSATIHSELHQIFRSDIHL